MEEKKKLFPVGKMVKVHTLKGRDVIAKLGKPLEGIIAGVDHGETLFPYFVSFENLDEVSKVMDCTILEDKTMMETVLTHFCDERLSCLNVDFAMWVTEGEINE